MKHKGPFLFLFILTVMITPVQAQAVTQQVETFFTDIEALMMAVATSAAVIGFIGLAIMNLGAPIPLIAEWKQENPKAARSVLWGLILLVFVGTGGLAAMLSF
jgi:hypothetical protein